jgi:Na+-driven multidrug efflux pump
VGLVTLLVLGVALTEALGIEGAALAVVLADVVLLAGTWLALRRDDHVDLRFAGRLAAAALPALGLALVPGLPDAVAAAGAVAAFLGLALALGLVPRDLLAAARR